MKSVSISVQAVRRYSKSGFSLIEVTLAIGLLAFCMIPLMGLIPTGLNAQHSAFESALATDAMNMLSTALQGSQYVSRDGGTGGMIFRLPQYFSDSTSPASNPTTYTTGKAPSTYAYAILDDGSIRKTGDTRTARQTMYIKIYPPSSISTDSANSGTLSPTNGTANAPATAVRVYALVAWPALPSDNPAMTPDQLKRRQGFVESYLTYVPSY